MTENEKLIEAERTAAQPTATAAAASEASNKDASAKSEEPTKTTQPKELTTKEAYFASLNAWVKHANISQNAMALFPYYLFSSYPQIFQNQGATGMGINPAMAATATATAADGFTRNGIAQQPGAAPAAGLGAANVANMGERRVNNMIVLSEQMQAEMINRTGGFEHIIAPFWKRALAELVDVCILLVLKLVVTFTVMNIFDFDLSFEFDKQFLRKSLEDDFLDLSTDFLALSSDLLMLEILTKVIVCIYEALWTRHGGATPGKMLLGLRIVYMEAMLPLQQQPPRPGFGVRPTQLKALLFPAEIPGFKRAFMRAVAKNVLMTLLFPMWFMVIFFKNNRTAYEIMTKTVVIEDNPNTVLRRR